MRTRLVLGAAGVALGLYGTYQLLRLGLDNLLATLLWLAGGVLLHDGAVAFATIIVLTIGSQLTPSHLKRPLAAAFLILTTVTLSAVPALGRFGARPDNPTLLDRNYLTGWLLLAALVAVATAVAVVLGKRRRRRE